MKAVILAAGDGTRLDPITRRTPKPLVAVAGHPMIMYGLHALIEVGVTELIIVYGHLGDQIRHELTETLDRGVYLTYVESPDQRDGSGLSLYAARDAIRGEPFILTMADHLISARLLRRLIAMQPEQDTLCVDHRPPPIVQLDEATRVWVNRRGYITHIAKRLLHWNGLDTGVFWLTPAVFRAVEALRAVASSAPTLTQACRWLIERGKGLRACDVSGLFWMDVDTPADLRRTERALEKRSGPLFQPALSRMA